MANPNLKIGSRGSDVTKWQQYLNTHGYNVPIDGVYSASTATATRNMQSGLGMKNTGEVDGSLWGGMNELPGVSEPEQKITSGIQDNIVANTPPQPKKRLSNKQQLYKHQDKYDKTFNYKPASYVFSAWDNYNDIMGQQPGDYESKYGSQIDGLLDQILNREKFSYDFNADPIYQQYSNKYQQQGQKAMMDTQSAAAGLTGGYGNSYGQMVGQQAYQDQLQNVNDVIPHLYDAAYGRYKDEGNKLRDDMSMVRSMDDTDYGRHRDDVGDWVTERDNAYDVYKDKRQTDWERQLRREENWYKTYDLKYGRVRDNKDDKTKKQQMDFEREQFEAQHGLAQQGSDREYELALGNLGLETDKFNWQKSKSSGGSGGGRSGRSGRSGGSGGSGGTSYKPTATAGAVGSTVTPTSQPRVANLSGDTWIHVRGYGRLSHAEVQDYIKKGKIKKKTNKNGSVSYEKK